MSDEGWIFYGFGAAHSVREESPPAPRLAGLRSVKNLQGGVLIKQPAQPRNPIGFHTGRPRA